MARARKDGRRENGGKTLRQLVEGYPCQKAAADDIGVREGTLNRWLHRHLEPKGLSRRRLQEMGVSSDERGRIVVG